MRHLSKATQAEQHELWSALCKTAIEWAKRNNFSGLSESGSHDIYDALSRTVSSQFAGARRAKMRSVSDIPDA